MSTEFDPLSGNHSIPALTAACIGTEIVGAGANLGAAGLRMTPTCCLALYGPAIKSQPSNFHQDHSCF